MLGSMQLKRTITLVLIAFLISMPSDLATANEGQKCQKLGQVKKVKGTSLICTKQGKKLTWKKTSISSTSIGNKSKSKSLYDKWLETGSKSIKPYNEWRAGLIEGLPQTQIEFWFSPLMSKELVEDARARMNYAVLQWERFIKVKRTRVFFDFGFYSDREIICSRLSARAPNRRLEWCIGDLERNSKNLSQYFAAALESEGGWIKVDEEKLSPSASVTHQYALLNELVFYGNSFYPRIEHEWIHQLQIDLSGYFYLDEYPCWFAEGSAEYLGLITAASKNPDAFVNYRAQNMGWHEFIPNRDYYRKWISELSISKLAGSASGDRCRQFKNSERIYMDGGFLTEWLVGKIGFPKLIELMRDVEVIGWAKAFEKYVGKSQEAALDEMVEYLLSEMEIIERNRDWLFLPICRDYQRQLAGQC